MKLLTLLAIGTLTGCTFLQTVDEKIEEKAPEVAEGYCQKSVVARLALREKWNARFRGTFEVSCESDRVVVTYVLPIQ